MDNFIFSKIFIESSIIFQIPSDIISTTEALLIRFKTDNTITSKGFSASYVAVESANSETYSGGE